MGYQLPFVNHRILTCGMSCSRSYSRRRWSIHRHSSHPFTLPSTVNHVVRGGDEDIFILSGSVLLPSSGSSVCLWFDYKTISFFSICITHQISSVTSLLLTAAAVRLMQAKHFIPPPVTLMHQQPIGREHTWERKLWFNWLTGWVVGYPVRTINNRCL